MQYFFDTEFHEDGKTIDLISLGMVAMDGRELYVANKEAELHRASPWLWEHVIPELPPYSDTPTWKTRTEIRDAVLDFVKDDGEKIEFWGYFSDYDWVVFCQLFGRMIDLPPHFPKFCMDVRQLRRSVGDPPLPKQVEKDHVAIHDARWTRQAYFSLEVMKPFACEAVRTLGLFPKMSEYGPLNRSGSRVLKGNL
jgi:hypothetical protein